jgi:hypothetical protein
MMMQCVFHEVEIEFLCLIQLRFIFQTVKDQQPVVFYISVILSECCSDLGAIFLFWHFKLRIMKISQHLGLSSVLKAIRNEIQETETWKFQSEMGNNVPLISVRYMKLYLQENKNKHSKNASFRLSDKFGKTKSVGYLLN